MTFILNLDKCLEIWKNAQRKGKENLAYLEFCPKFLIQTNQYSHINDKSGLFVCK